jgi:hypothetical protein
MAIVSALEMLRSRSIRKKFGRPNGYGEIVFGYSKYGDNNPLAGIYRVRRIQGKLQTEKLPFYYKGSGNTEEQLALRLKFGSAILAWQALTYEEKQPWRVRAYSRHMTGYNAFISDFMKTP